MALTIAPVGAVAQYFHPATTTPQTYTYTLPALQAGHAFFRMIWSVSGFTLTVTDSAGNTYPTFSSTPWIGAVTTYDLPAGGTVTVTATPPTTPGGDNYIQFVLYVVYGFTTITLLPLGGVTTDTSTSNSYTDTWTSVSSRSALAASHAGAGIFLEEGNYGSAWNLTQAPSGGATLAVTVTHDADHDNMGVSELYTNSHFGGGALASESIFGLFVRAHTYPDADNVFDSGWDSITTNCGNVPSIGGAFFWYFEPVQDPVLPTAALVRDPETGYLHAYVTGNYAGTSTRGPLVLDVYRPRSAVNTFQWQATRTIDGGDCRYPSFYWVDGVLCGTYLRGNSMLFACSVDRGLTWTTQPLPGGSNNGGNGYDRLLSVAHRHRLVLFGYGSNVAALGYTPGNTTGPLYVRAGALKRDGSGAVTFNWGADWQLTGSAVPTYQVRDPHATGMVALACYESGAAWKHYQTAALGLTEATSPFGRIGRYGDLPATGSTVSDFPSTHQTGGVDDGEFYQTLHCQVLRGRLVVLGFRKSTQRWYARAASWTRKSSSPSAANPNLVWGPEAALPDRGPATPLGCLNTLEEDKVVFGYQGTDGTWHLQLAPDLGVDGTATWFPFLKP